VRCFSAFRQCLNKTRRTAETAHVVHVFLRAAPTGHGEAKRHERLGAGLPEGAKAKNGHRPRARERRRRRVPGLVRVDDMRVHVQVMAEHMAHNPFHHALGQPVFVHHPRQRHGQSRIAHHGLDARPKVEHGLQTGERCEILNVRIGGVNDVVDLFCRDVCAEMVGTPECVQSSGQRRLPFGPAFGFGGKEDVQHAVDPLRGGVGWVMDPSYVNGGDGRGRFAPSQTPEAAPAWPIRHSSPGAKARRRPAQGPSPSTC